MVALVCQLEFPEEFQGAWAGLFGGEAEDVLDVLGQGAAKSKSESVVVPAGFVGLLLKVDNEGGELLVVVHLEIEEVLFGLRYSVKYSKLT
ncbi:hypothetical protein C0993_001124 [Termitomyces sp. T159_Od127]|nr:hypothetical protein C0993_001124 [Termitomyces sp. T159_Od127]